MQIKLTERSVAALELPADRPQLVVWDTDLSGFGVVVGKTTRTFVAQTRVDGEKRRTKIGIAGHARADGARWTVQLARTEALKLLGSMRDGVDPHAAARTRRGGPTLREALDFHLGKMERGENRRRKVCSPRSVRTLRGTVELHLADYLDGPLLDLTADVLDDVRKDIEREAERIAGSNPANPPGRAVGNRLLANVSAIWRSWHKRHGLPETCPVERLTPGALKPRDTRVANEDLPSWYAKLHAKGRDGEEVMSPVRRDLQLLSMFTGVRTDGVRNLTWDDVDFDEDLIEITRAKGDRPYTLPMTTTVRQILERRQRDNVALMSPFGGDHGFVFPSLARDGRTVIAVAEVKERHVKRDAKGRPMTDDDDNVIRETYLPGVHANRRTFNSVAIEIGIPREARETLMNHEGRGVNVRHYGRPQNWDYLRSCAEQVEAALWARIEGKVKRGRGRKLRAA